MNYRMIGYVLGWIFIFEAAFMTVPVITGLIYGESVILCYLMTIGICGAIGALLLLVKKPQKRQLYARDGYAIASLSWLLLSLFGAIPLCVSGEIPSYLDAVFEAASGFTTTGASILEDVEKLSHASLIWRSFTHWVGGMGVLVFIMAFLPLSGAQNMHIMRAESPGPAVSRLVPKVKNTALILYAIYFVLTLIEFILLLCGGMTVFEALNTAFATAGTGGFGIYNSSMGSFSPYLQIVVTVFMLLFSVNFNSYFLIGCRRFKEAFNTELRVFFGIVAVVVLTVAVDIASMYASFGEALRHSAFAVASIISTTGFSTENFDIWPELSRTLLVLIMFIGACAGSTGGGMKVSRLVILFKGLAKEFATMVHPKQVKKVKLDSKIVEHEVVRSVNVFVIAYVLVFVVSLLIISINNHDIITNFTAVAATINNIGPGLELVGPTHNFAFFSPLSKIVLIFDMLAGRLEIFPMLLLFHPATWKK